MRLIDEFAARVLASDDAFLLQEPKKQDRWMFFVQGWMGDAKFVYGSYGFNKNFFTELRERPELIAIVAQDKVYVVNTMFLDVWQHEYVEEQWLPENVVDFYRSYIGALNDRLNTVIFPVFYEALESVEVDIDVCRARARNGMLAADTCRYTKAPFIVAQDGFHAEDAVKILCGFLDADEEAKKRLEEDRDYWCKQKTEYEKTMELIAAGDGAEEWERRMADGLKSVEAVNVTVEFSMNGKTASGKMPPSKIFDNLVKRDNFDYWDFASGVEGKTVLRVLEATDHWRENPLKCEHINRITYGKKVLFER